MTSRPYRTKPFTKQFNFDRREEYILKSISLNRRTNMSEIIRDLVNHTLFDELTEAQKEEVIKITKELDEEILQRKEAMGR